MASNNGANADHYRESQSSYTLAGQTHPADPDKNGSSLYMRLGSGTLMFHRTSLMSEDSPCTDWFGTWGISACIVFSSLLQ